MLLAAIVAAAAVGAVLLRPRADQPLVTPPQASTLGPRPATSAPRSTAPTAGSTTDAPTIDAPTSNDPTTPASTREPTRPTPADPATTPPPTTKPTTRPTEPKTAEDYLVRNPLYARSIRRSDCSQPPRPLPTSQKTDERYLKNLTACMVSAYASSMKAAHFTMTRPDVRIYTGTIQTPCGQGLKGYPVFYCGSNETIYSSAGSTAQYGETLRLGGYWIVFHEFAHHVQQRAGVLDAAYARDESQLQISRRIELQADCLMGMTSSSVRSVKLTATDRAEMVDWRRQVPDKIHGTSASQLYWVQRGFGTRLFRRCSTWTATKHIG